MRKIILICLVFLTGIAYAQPRVLQGLHANGMPGKLIPDTVISLNVTSPLFAVNDSTIGSNATDSLRRSNDSVYARKNGIWKFQYKDSTGGAGGSPGGNSRNIQFNMDGNFSGNDSLKFNAGAINILGGINLTPTSTVNKTINFGAGYTNPAIVLYDGGTNGTVSSHGWGLTAGNMQFYNNSALFTWSRGGSWPPSYGSAPPMQLSATGLGVNVSASTVFHANSTTVAAATPGVISMLTIGRPINGGTCYPQAATLDLGTYGTNNSGTGFGPRSRLDIKLKSTATDNYTTDVTAATFQSDGNVGIGVTPATARLHLMAGTATASTAPLKFTSGTLLSTAEAGAMEFDGTNLYFSPSTTRLTADLSLTGSAALDFGSTSAQTSADLTITVTGAADGDVVSLGVPNGAANANTNYTAWVSAANTVTVRFNNYSSGAIDPTSGTFKVRVIK